MEQVKEPVKEEREHVLANACRIMAGVSPAASSVQTQHPLPTPSPFSFSVTSTRWSSRPFIHHSNIFFRFLVLLFSFILALSLAAPSANKKGQGSPSFTQHPELIYCFIVPILAFLYAAFQLFKGICDIAHRGILISDMTSDYLNFVVEQPVVVGGLPSHLNFFSCNIIGRVEETKPVWKGTIISTSTSFAAFLVTAICALLSGYKLCKRISW